MESNSVDSIVTDPPYGLKFMNKKWDHSVPSIEFWEEVLRVLKPGGHVLSFGGTRTYHRMAVNIEDAGFEIRDQIMWLYGSGFPKSHNISKAIDKKLGAKREVLGKKSYADGTTARETSAYRGNCLNEAVTSGSNNFETKPSTDLAKQWDGYGTALKPANEPIVMARKPLSEKTIVDNVLKWGVGCINIDECRVEGVAEKPFGREVGLSNGNNKRMGKMTIKEPFKPHAQGRFPANIILDEQAGQVLDAQSDNASRFFYCAKASKKERNAGLEGIEAKFTQTMGNGIGKREHDPKNPTAYNQNHHPTVKPIKLMEYLIKLVTPTGGTVLDPFMGSGSTGIAAKNLGFDFVGTELDEDYFEIASKRIEGL